MDTLLYWPSPGRNFFEIWRLNPPVQAALGYPIYERYSNVAGLANTIELPFQRGNMQILLAPDLCYRIYNSNELAMRAAAGCELLTKCKRTPETKQKEWQPGDEPPTDPDPEPVSFLSLPHDCIRSRLQS
jgi:hypothetical protein